MKSGVLGALVAIVAAGTALAQSKSHVHTEWHESKLSLDVCKQKAEVALEKSSFAVEGRSASQSRYGRRAGYVVGIRCIPEKEMIFFLIAGPDWDQANTYFDRVIENFR